MSAGARTGVAGALAALLCACAPCDGCGQRSLGAEDRAPTTSATGGLPAVPDAANLPTDVTDDAPASVDFYGLRLGVAEAPDVDAFVTSLGLPCSDGLDASGSVHRYECRDVEGAVPFTHRPTGGQVARVIVETAPDGPAFAASIRRRHAEAGAGLEDYESAVAAAAASLGPPQVFGGFAAAMATSEPARETSTWTSERGTFEVEVLRGMGSDLFVTESWRLAP